MAVTMLLTAASDNDDERLVDDELGALPESTVTIVVDPQQGNALPADGIKLFKDSQDVGDPTVPPSTWQLSGNNKYGLFVAKGVNSDDESNQITVKPRDSGAPPAPPTDAAGDDVTETDIGEYDPSFAGVVAGMVGVSVVVIVLLAAWGVGAFGLGTAGRDDSALPAPSQTATAETSEAQGTPAEVPATTPTTQPGATETPESEPTPSPSVSVVGPTSTESKESGSYLERAGVAVSGLVAVVGGVLLVSGAGLAALEVRGRLRRRLSPTGDSAGARSTQIKEIKEIIEASAKFMDSARVTRGTVAVLLFGVILVLVALFAVSCGLAAETGGDGPGATTEATPTVEAPLLTDEPSAEPAASPGG